MFDKTFKIGGIHPREYKFAGSAFLDEVLPDRVYLPTIQHIGVAAIPIVKKGDKVKVGTKIAKGSGTLSANIHSSVSGVVEDIILKIDSSGLKRDTIVIKREGDEWEDDIDRTATKVSVTNLNPMQMLSRIEEMGVVGMGGATFPAHVKFRVTKPITTLLVNGAECEPFLTCDDALMNNFAEELFIGIEAVLKILGISDAYIGIENNKLNAINNLKKYETSDIKVVPLKVKYPQGSEKQLITAILKKEVPSGKLTTEVGVVVSNVATIYAIYQAIYKNRPLISRLLTISGKVENSVNVFSRLGITINDLISAINLKVFDYESIIAGGPLMGKGTVSIDVPVTKGLSGILFLDEPNYLERNCIRCYRCYRGCPMGLLPVVLKDLVKNRDWSTFLKMNGRNCFECGACTYSCPSNIPILDHIRMGKTRKESV